jgi:hypothetical protein
MSDSEVSESSASDSSESPLYEVERILAQDELDGKMHYLVKWRDYGEEQCTWEPAENFSNPQTLRDWNERLRIGDTLDDEGVASLQERMNAFVDLQTEQRRLRRTSKRRRLMKGPKPREFSSSESDTPMILNRPKPTKPSASKSASSLENLPPKSRSTFASASPSGLSRAQPLSKLKSKPSNSAVTPRAPPKPTPKGVAVSPMSLSNAALQQQNPAKHATVSSNTQQEVTTPSVEDTATRIPSAVKKNPNISSTLVSKGKPDNLKSVAEGHSESRAGERFKSLQHRNNYAKSARREGVPDMSRMELKTPEEWTRQPVTAPLSPSAQSASELWLFVPEDGQIGVASPTAMAGSPTEQSTHPENESSAPPREDRERHTQRSGEEQSSELQAVRSRRSSQADKIPSTIDKNHSHGVEKPTLVTRRLSENIPRPAPVDRRLVQPDRRMSSIGNQTDLQLVRKHSRASGVHPFQPLSGKQSESSVSTGKASDAVLGVITTRSGRLVKPGVELLVFLSLNDHAVGDVKFLHFPPWLRTKLKALKPPGEGLLRIEFQQQEVRNWAEYSTFARDYMGPSCALGEIEAYEDTQPSADSLADYLKSASVCAMWIYPDPLETLALILYSPEASEWSHLGKNMTTPAYKNRLRLLVCNTRSPLHSRQPQHDQGVLRRMSGDHVNTAARYTTVVAEGPLEVGNTPGRRIRPSWDGDVPLARNLETHHTDIRGNTAKPDLPNKADTGDKMYHAPFLSTSDFQYLTTFPSRIKADPRNARVFIAFTNIYPSEACVLRDWLGEHVKTRNIFSDTEKDGWEEFLESTEQKAAVALFHERVSNFTLLRKLSSRLKADTLVCFNASFDNMGRISFTRIFPRGTVLCITESCMTGFLEQTLDILRWFESSASRKGSSWKLVLFPDAVNKCFQRLATLGVGPQKVLADILGIVLRLTKRSTRSLMEPDQYISGDTNFDREGGTNDSLVLSPPQLLGHNTHAESGILSTDESATRLRDQIFSEYLRGWTVLNCTKYRRMLVIDDKMTNQTEPHSCHIIFTHPKRFLEENNFKK